MMLNGKQSGMENVETIWRGVGSVETFDKNRKISRTVEVEDTLTSSGDGKCGKVRGEKRGNVRPPKIHQQKEM